VRAVAVGEGGKIRPAAADWAREAPARFVRGFLQRLLLLPFVRWLGRPLRVDGRAHLEGAGPYVFVANHSSHADTAALLAALPARIRRRAAPAAAEDYFFSSRLRGFLVSLLTGAFPFPRCGRAGLRRAEHLLARGWSVVLFPEGTRSCDGRVHTFKPGVEALARAGWPVVPVGLAGTGEVLPKGARLPRRSPTAVVFGEPVAFEAHAQGIAPELGRRVEALAARARRDLAAPRRRLHDRFAAFARSPRAPAFCFGWGVAEALIFPVIPDFALAPLALAAPGRALVLALCATAGSVAGGTIAHVVGSTEIGPAIATHLPLVTERMSAFASDSLAGGADGLLRQPMSGVPYKAFAYQAADAGIGLGSFLWFSVLARGGRMLAIAAFFGVAGAGGRRVWRHVFGAFLVLYTVGFTVGLARVVASWS
jgi:1-acyl-sn-glycerol-3-phosphate acyltransferase